MDSTNQIRVAAEMPISYQGKQADQHYIDASQFSRSLAGSTRLYTLVGHYCLTLEVAAPRKQIPLTCYARPNKEGSFEAFLALAYVANEYQMFADIYKDALDWLISKVMGFVKDSLTGGGGVKELIEVIKQQAKDSADLNTLLANGLTTAHADVVKLQEKLIETLPQLVAAAKPSYRAALAPVGKSCHSMTQFAGTDEEILISEAEAMAIRSDADMEVGAAAEFQIERIFGLNVKTGLCRIQLKDRPSHVAGQVVDVELSVPNNAYSKALNEHIGIKVRAKPVFKDGELHRLFISESLP